MKKVILFILLLFIAGCNEKEVITYEETIQTLVDIDLAHNTSLWNESMKERLLKEEIYAVRADVTALQSKLAKATSRSEREYKSIVNLVESRLRLLDSEEAFNNYVNTASGATCDEPGRMWGAVDEFRKAIDFAQEAINHWDTALNAHRPALEELAKQRERPAFTALPMWKYYLDLSDYESVLNTYCPLGGEALKKICDRNGVCVIFGPRPTEDNASATL